MKVNDTVTIYEDYNGQTKPEGQARLVKRVSASYTEGPERWEVKFPDYDQVVERLILVK